jgi:hypothetical protein
VRRRKERAVALADPQSVTISGSAVPLPRTGLSLDKGTFTDASRQTELSVLHSTGRRTRHTIKVQKTAVVSDPLVPSTNQNVSYSAHIVLDMPKNGVSSEDVIALGNALVAWASSANLTKVVGGES